jgi:organic radical activating enzyme
MNDQPPEHRSIDPDNIEIVGSPFLTIQGEGPFTGRRSVFVRFAGCNLQCPLCDTDYTSNRRIIEIGQLWAMIKQVRRPYDLVVITGGEPFRQHVGLLHFLALTPTNCQVQIETNGTHGILKGLTKLYDIVCSPKSSRLHWSVLKDPNVVWKYTLKAGEIDEDGLPLKALRGFRPARPPGYVPAERIWVLPADEGSPRLNQRNLQATLRSAMDHGYRIGIQLHKYLNLQ